MVLTVTTPLWSDIADRSSRQLGVVYGLKVNSGLKRQVMIAGNDGLMVSPKPWWCHDGFGEVIALDDFEGTLKWAQTSGTVTRASDATFVHEGSYALKLVTGNVAGNGCIATLKTSPMLYAWDYQQMEFWFTINAAAVSTPRDFYMMWFASIPSTNHTKRFGLRYFNYNATVAQNKWQYWGSGAAWVDLAAMGVSQIPITTPEFHHVLVRLLCSPSPDPKYSVIQIDDTLCDLTGVNGEQGVYDPANHCQLIEAGCTTDAAFATTAYVDSFILHSGPYSPE